MLASAKNKVSLFWIFFGLSVVLWIYSFWVFLSRQAPLLSDALSFYDHLKFYIDNISRGVYPMWDPLWSGGSPNEFFLRRIGPFNPFLLLIIIPYKLGLSYWIAFAGFLTFYFFLGMLGFYKLTLEILKDQGFAIIAFVLLTFSSLGTRVFDSYLMMVMTPMIWFFYFGFVFGRGGQTSALLGMVFCTMLLMTTYIPFYFLVVVLSFMILFLFIYPKAARDFVLHLGGFIKKNPWLFLLCVGAIVSSCLPGISFFKSAGQGTFTMPLRHFDAIDPHALTVKEDVTTYWAIPEDLMFSSFYLEDLRLFDFAVFYVPLFAFIILLISVITRVNRKTLFIFVWATFLLLMGSPYLLPVYNFLHNHIFFFKYFRNLHFFLWFAILPLFILFVVEQMRLFLKLIDDNPRWKILSLVFILVIHAAVAVFLFWRQSFNYSTWIVFILSLLFFVSYWRQKLSTWLLCGLCFCAIVLQPLEAFYSLQGNVVKNGTLSIYDKFQPQFEYTSGQKSVLTAQSKNGPLYFATQWYTLLWDHMDATIIKNYSYNKFIFYDRVAIFDEQKDDLKTLAQVWVQNLNVAFVPPGTPADVLKIAKEAGTMHADNIEKESAQLRVTQSDVNGVKLKIHLLTSKFLVFNDGYYPGWHAYINGKETPLYRANVAFKGIWLALGEQEVEFRFGQSARYKIEPSLLIFTFLFFMFFIWAWRKELKTPGSS